MSEQFTYVVGKLETLRVRKQVDILISKTGIWKTMSNHCFYPTEAIQQSVLYSSYYSVITDSYYPEKH